MTKAEYMREYRLKNLERLLAQQKDYYHRVRKHRNRGSRRKNPRDRCELCSIFLDSKFGGRGRRKYCNDCVTRHVRQLYNLYMRRAYQKRVGKPQEKVTFENII